ncbi:ATP-binding cassette domain-containing protein, partial [Arthrospira platensis SPKY1]|nr:ATP-binding cassette domain-containing protein [Arthrospira platensis SPKY1]
MLSAIDISLSLGGKPILNEVSANFCVGEVSAIIGPNGAGKSTLLKILSAAFLPDSGLVLLDEKPIATMAAEDLAKRRAVLSQESLLQFDFTVEEVVLLGRIPHLGARESRRDL